MISVSFLVISYSQNPVEYGRVRLWNCERSRDEKVVKLSFIQNTQANLLICYISSILYNVSVVYTCPRRRKLQRFS